MSNLGSSSTVSEWEASLSEYSECLQSLSKTSKRRGKLPNLDHTVRVKLPESIRTRYSDEASYGYLTREELCDIVNWKITVRP